MSFGFLLRGAFYGRDHTGSAALVPTGLNLYATIANRSLLTQGGGSVPEPEQPPRILPADLRPVILADRAGIEPDRGVVDVLERPVGREHDAVSADFEHGVVERRRVEIARRGDVEILAEIFAQPLLCRPAVPVLDPGIGVVD